MIFWERGPGGPDQKAQTVLTLCACLLDFPALVFSGLDRKIGIPQSQASYFTKGCSTDRYFKVKNHLI